MIEKYILRLSPDFSQCPIYWQHFVRSVNTDHKSGHLLKPILEDEYNARYNWTRDLPYREPPVVVFESEEDFLFFKLKWS